MHKSAMILESTPSRSPAGADIRVEDRRYVPDGARRTARNSLTTNWLIPTTLIVLTSASRARAWGSEGHRIIGEIAEQYHEPATAREVRNILSIENETTLAGVSTWADQIRGHIKAWGSGTRQLGERRPRNCRSADLQSVAAQPRRPTRKLRGEGTTRRRSPTCKSGCSSRDGFERGHEMMVLFAQVINIVIKSINPQYETYERDAEEVSIIGRVIWAAKRL